MSKDIGEDAALRDRSQSSGEPAGTKRYRASSLDEIAAQLDRMADLAGNGPGSQSTARSRAYALGEVYGFRRAAEMLRLTDLAEPAPRDREATKET